ncbi:hypothetical protein EAE99_003833 [Botrytis elliptica]|nr:hypothetical protein EAE99_003833 [Botrytis elliptica]
MHRNVYERATLPLLIYGAFHTTPTSNLQPLTSNLQTKPTPNITSSAPPPPPPPPPQKNTRTSVHPLIRASPETYTLHPSTVHRPQSLRHLDFPPPTILRNPSCKPELFLASDSNSNSDADSDSDSRLLVWRHACNAMHIARTINGSERVMRRYNLKNF